MQNVTLPSSQRLPNRRRARAEPDPLGIAASSEACAKSRSAAGFAKVGASRRFDPVHVSAHRHAVDVRGEHGSFCSKATSIRSGKRDLRELSNYPRSERLRWSDEPRELHFDREPAAAGATEDRVVARGAGSARTSTAP